MTKTILLISARLASAGLLAGKVNVEKSALISDCGKFRYSLTRTWDRNAHSLGFVMLNPSTADADIDDPTIRKCIGFAKRFGYGSIIVNNLFAFRATDPKELKRNCYLVGDLNDENISAMNALTEKIVCAWGVNARGINRVNDVLKLIKNPYALRLTNDGIPWHPLMLPYSCELIKLETVAT